MTREEKVIWRATYAAEYVRSFHVERSAVNACESAIDTANNAVEQLRARRTTGRPDAGKKVTWR